MWKWLVPVFIVAASMKVGVAAEAVCVAKNQATGQLFKSVKGSRSYRVSRDHAARLVLETCARYSRPINQCKITACYQR